MNNIMLTDIDTGNITKEIIKTVLFSNIKTEYNSADCLIVFGCHIKELIDERINLALDILKNKKVEKILLTGGIGVHGDFNESEYMKNVLLNHGIDNNIILVDDESTTTEENVENSIEILKNNNLIENKRLVLVSNAAHLKRIGMELKKGLKDINFEIIYEYPNASLISFENVIKNKALNIMAINEVKKIINFIKNGIIDDESLFNIKPMIFNIKELEDKANNKDGLSCYLLGRSYDSGENGLDKDPYKALYWYNRGANLNDPRCIYGVAACYYFGDGVNKDENIAYDLFVKAYNPLLDLINKEEDTIKRQAFSIFCLGAYYYFGFGDVEKNEQKAFELIYESALKGHIAGIYDLGANFYYNGVGTEKNIKLSKYFLELADKYNLPRARQKLVEYGFINNKTKVKN